MGMGKWVSFSHLVFLHCSKEGTPWWLKETRTAMAACASLSIGLNIFTCSTAFCEVIMISNYRFFLVKVQAERDLHPLFPEQ